MDVIPEKRSYAPGEKARLQVRLPFREATALVSVEADGVIDTFVQPLSRYKPYIDLPVKAEWGPNVFVSVLAVRGRVQPVKWTSFFDWGWREPMAWFKEWWNPTLPTAMVDLAKPAYKVGLAALDVGIDGFRLKVDVAPEKADYRPRDTAKVRVKVTQPDGKPVPAGTEVALAAVDQALLELRPNESWKLLEAMLPRRGYEVQTATAQSQVIGKRHFGKKAVPPGGGGGRAPARELFDTLLLWNPRVVLDGSGSATVTVPINDSLSEFKVVAVAAAGTSLFGTGSGSFRTRQDLQMISGLPPLVREKDRFAALLTLRNGTAKPMTVHPQRQGGRQDPGSQGRQARSRGRRRSRLERRSPRQRHRPRLGVRSRRQRQRRQGPPEDHPTGRACRAGDGAAGQLRPHRRQARIAGGPGRQRPARPRRHRSRPLPAHFHAAARVEALLRGIPLRLPGAENLRRHRPQRREALAAGGRSSAHLPGRQRAGPLFSRRPARQPQPHRLPAGRQPGRRLCNPAGHRRAHGERPAGLRRGSHQTRALGAHQRPDGKETQRPGSPHAPRPQAPGRHHQPRPGAAHAPAHGRPHRLGSGRQAPHRTARPRPASGRRRAGNPQSPELPGRAPGLHH
ncbi:MAG: hypothetical protein IPM73_09100 [Betaproteobacteria bacterium]|nr:hypothetical protein [Betaproteobacteria bacterium]